MFGGRRVQASFLNKTTTFFYLYFIVLIALHAAGKRVCSTQHRAAASIARRARKLNQSSRVTFLKHICFAQASQVSKRKTSEQRIYHQISTNKIRLRKIRTERLRILHPPYKSFMKGSNYTRVNTGNMWTHIHLHPGIEL